MASYVLLERIELNATAFSVVFANIPQTGYTDLKIVASMRSAGSPGSGYSVLGYRFNNSTSSYSAKTSDGTGAAVYADTMTTAVISSNTYGRFTSYGINTGGTTTSTFTSMEWHIPNYTSSSNKSSYAEYVTENSGTTAYQGLMSLLWSDSAAISQIELVTDTSFAQYSTFSLYGLAASGTTPAIAPKASGGNIQTDGTYWYHTFFASGTFTPQTTLSCDYLVVAGGGGASRLGGAGAGGLRSTVTSTGGGGSLESAISVSTAQTVTIGAGGAGCLNTGGDTSLRGQNGSNSVFGSITSTGGGGGASGGNAGFSGGSGGGAWPGGGTGAGTSGQGYAGGSGGNNASPYGGGGGGGAGAVGQSQQAGNTAGTGGNGVQITALATPTNSGANSGYYAGGGGGSSDSSVSTKAGGLGGGGNGGGLNAGTVNTGGGGGAQGGVSGLGGAGGSGIVIIRYAV